MLILHIQSVLIEGQGRDSYKHHEPPEGIVILYSFLLDFAII